MSRWCRVLAILLLAILAAGSAADAATKKKAAKQPAKPKAIYEAPMTVVIVRGSEAGCEPLCPEWISAEGEITSATPAAFRKVFKQMGKAKLPIVIRSPGGSINHAIEIGRMIRKRKLDVAVGYTFFTKCSPDDKKCKLPKEAKGVYSGLAQSRLAFCFSACPMVLAGGTTRLASADTYVGVHQPRTTWTQDRVYYRERYRIINGRKKVIDRKVVSRKRGKTSFTYGMDKRLRKKLATYYKEMGVDAALLDDSEKAKFSSVNILTGERLSQLALRTAPHDVNFLTTSKNCRSNPPGGNCVMGKGGNDKIETAAVVFSLKRSPVIAYEPEMTVTVMRNSSVTCEPYCPEWIAARGKIAKQTPALLKKILNGLGETKLPIFINSLGGEFDAAIEMGKLIHENKLDVGVADIVSTSCSGQSYVCKAITLRNVRLGFPKHSGKCEGACVFVLSAGQKRMIADTASVVFQNPSTFTSLKSKQPVDQQIKTYFKEMLVKDTLFELAMNIDPASPRQLSIHDLDQTLLISSSWTPLWMTASNSCIWQPSHCVMVK